MTREEQIAHLNQTNAVLNMQPALEWAREQGYAEAMAVLEGVVGAEWAHQLLLDHWFKTHPPLMVSP